jgi:hypothetical protein
MGHGGWGMIAYRSSPEFTQTRYNTGKNINAPELEEMISEVRGGKIGVVAM